MKVCKFDNISISLPVFNLKLVSKSDFFPEEKRYALFRVYFVTS